MAQDIACSQDGLFLEDACEDLRANRSLVITAVEQNADALHNASQVLQGWQQLSSRPLNCTNKCTVIVRPSHPKLYSGPNRAMQPRCAMRFESHTPKSLAIRKSFFSLAMRKTKKNIRLIWIHRKMQEKKPAKILRCWLAMRKIGVFLKVERCEMPAIRTPAAVWPAMRAPRCQIAGDSGRAMRNN